jgi:hypothetical protein
MKILKRAGQPQPTKLEQRVSKIGTSELVSWAENSLYVIGKELTHFQKEHDQTMLDDALLGAEALTAIVKELMKRSEF